MSTLLIYTKTFHCSQSVLSRQLISFLSMTYRQSTGKQLYPSAPIKTYLFFSRSPKQDITKSSKAANVRPGKLQVLVISCNRTVDGPKRIVGRDLRKYRFTAPALHPDLYDLPPVVCHCFFNYPHSYKKVISDTYTRGHRNLQKIYCQLVSVRLKLYMIFLTTQTLMTS